MRRLLPVFVGLLITGVFPYAALAEPVTISIEAEADTYVRSGAANTNEGGSAALQIQASGNNRVLLRFPQVAVDAAMGGGTLLSATLEMAISANGNNWGASGRTIDLHRVTVPWAEGNGSTGSGATWNCAVDSSIANSAKDCTGTAEWFMSGSGDRPWESAATATQLIMNGQGGTVSFDVKADVEAFVLGTPNNGWIVRKTDEGASGSIIFSSRETASKPVLVLVVEPPLGGNFPPVIAGNPPFRVNEGSAYFFAPVSSDADPGDILTFSVQNRPHWLDFDPETGALSGTPSAGDADIYRNIVITVTDSENQSASLPAFDIAVTMTLTAAADTFIYSGSPNTNEGGAALLRVQQAGNNRVLVRFGHPDLVSYVAGRTVLAAYLEADILNTGNNWGPGRTVDVHRMLQDWAEGNGKVAGTAPSDRGVGPGATWNCAIDTNITNTAKDCSGATEWSMGNPSLWPMETVPTGTVLIQNAQTGTVAWDVTADVIAFLAGTKENYGWLVRKTEEGQGGLIEFDSKESGNPPRLALVLEGDEPPADAMLTCMPEQIDFGAVGVGAESDTSFITCTNELLADVAVDTNSFAVTDSENFDISVAGVSGEDISAGIFHPGDYVTFGIIFRPQETGPLSSVISFEYVTSSEPTEILLTGIGEGISGPVQIVIFSATPPVIGPGDASVLVWLAANATSCEINSIPVDTSGNVQVAPPVSKVYTFTCNGEGGPVSAQAVVAVQSVSGLTCIPGIIDFGAVTANSGSSSAGVICHNMTEQLLEVDLNPAVTNFFGAAASDFALGSTRDFSGAPDFPPYIGPGEYIGFEIVFNPSETGQRLASLVLGYVNEAAITEIPLTGTGTEPSGPVEFPIFSVAWDGNALCAEADSPDRDANLGAGEYASLKRTADSQYVFSSLSLDGFGYSRAIPIIPFRDVLNVAESNFWTQPLKAGHYTLELIYGPVSWGSRTFEVLADPMQRLNTVVEVPVNPLHSGVNHLTSPSVKLNDDLLAVIGFSGLTLLTTSGENGHFPEIIGTSPVRVSDSAMLARFICPTHCPSGIPDQFLVRYLDTPIPEVVEISPPYPVRTEWTVVNEFTAVALTWGEDGIPNHVTNNDDTIVVMRGLSDGEITYENVIIPELVHPYWGVPGGSIYADHAPVGFGPNDALAPIATSDDTVVIAGSGPDYLWVPSSPSIGDNIIVIVRGVQTGELEFHAV